MAAPEEVGSRNRHREGPRAWYPRQAKNLYLTSGFCLEFARSLLSRVADSSYWTLGLVGSMDVGIRLLRRWDQVQGLSPTCLTSSSQLARPRIWFTVVGPSLPGPDRTVVPPAQRQVLSA